MAHFHPLPGRILTLTAMLVTLAPFSQAAPPAPTADTLIYETREGDTLITLGERLLARPQDWRRVAELNRIEAPRRIPVGTRLRFPVSLLKHVPRDGTVLAAVGEASLQSPDGTPRSIRQGDALPRGSVVRTASNGYVTVKLADGSVLRIQADTEARLDTSRQYQQAGFFASVWEVVRGRVEALVTHMTGGEPRFQVKTPQAVLGVRGTEFRVDADATRGQTRGETLTGAVAVQGGRGETLVRAGFGTVTATGMAPAAARPLPVTPDVAGLPALQERILVRFQLPSVPQAVAYRGQVAEDEQFQLVRGEVTSSTPQLRFADLPDGDYVLRARAIDAQGLESPDAIHRFKLKARPEAPIAATPAPDSKWRTASVPLAWAAHPKAWRYRVQVATAADFQSPLLDRDDLTETALDVPLPPGDYHWRVATTAAGADRGPWGDPQRFSVRPQPAALPPPQITDDTLAFQMQGEPGQTFELQLGRDTDFQPLVAAQHSGDARIVLPKPKEGGLLHVRYRAIDPDGFVGPWTAPQELRLPACVRSGTGECLGASGRVAVSPP
jgi:hypothetical protein